ncbi:MAG: GRAM domain-containing protein [Bacteroidota bacterium]|nr:GRAM domain-containing protein [Bacteroidota bacterium]
MKVDLKPNEVVTKASDANHFINGGNEKVKGKLILTNQRIYFKSSQLGSDDFNKEVNPEEIEEVMVFNTFKILPNGLNIITKEGNQLRFVVKKRDQWCRMINKIY